jgi:oxalate decarboxylase/phosphoglucose isomerase-like protein (cupin superfamily)
MCAESLPRRISLPSNPNAAGDLIYIQADLHLPFVIRRVYFVRGIPVGALRGGHAHKRCHELVVAASGAMTVGLEAQDGALQEHRLDDPGLGLYIPPLYWRVVRDYAPDSLCLVLASEDYDPEEYIRDHGRFRAFGRIAEGNLP